MIDFLNWLGVNTAGYDGLVPEISPPWWGWVLFFILAAALALKWTRGATVLLDSRAGRTAIFSLRTVVLIILGMILLDPSLVLEQRLPVRPRAVVLWDTSRSMSLEGDESFSRLEVARRWWRGADSLRKRLEENYRSEVWTFGDGASPQPEAFTAGPEGRPDGDRTDIMGVLRRVARSGGDAPAAVILISDGADNASLEEAAKREDGIARALEDYPAPVFVAPLGKSKKHKDIGIEKLEVGEYGFVRNAVEIKVTVSARGLMGTQVPVTLMEGRRVITSKNVSINSDDGRWSLDLAFTPDQVGDFLFVVEIPHYEDEATFENNSRTFSLRVMRDKIRVLHVVGRPSWDVRFLRESLKKDPTIELISFYILRQPLDAPGAHTNELSLIPFPTDELFDTKIRTFDLIILQNFPWAIYMRPAYLENIHDFVMDFGGGFLMIGGPMGFTGGRYINTPIQDILPVELAREAPFFREGEYHPRLTEAGSRHPISALDTDPQDNRRLWDSFPPLEAYNIVGPAKPGATVLLEHPFQQASSDMMPLLAVWSVGRGRAMSLATDTSFRWNLYRAVEGHTAEEYLRFWRAAVRWLVGDPEGKQVRARMNRSKYTPGQELHLRVKVLDRDYAPAYDAGIEATLEGNEQSLSIKGFEREGDDVTVKIDNPGPGGWRIKIKAFDEEGVRLGEDEVVFVVEQESREFSPPWPNHELLENVANATGGAVWNVDKSPDPNKLPQPTAWRVVGRRRLPLWDNWVAGGLLLIVLGAEWYLRRRWGLN